MRYPFRIPVHMHLLTLPAMSPLTSPTGSGSPAHTGCTCAKLRRLTRRVTAVYDHALAAAGLRVTQFSLLASLRAAREDVPVSRLAESQDMDRTSLTRTLKPLVDAGWVVVRPSPDDARVRLVSITPEGEAQWQAARVHWRRAQDEVRATLGADTLGALHHLLDNAVPLFRPSLNEEGTPS